MKSVLFTALCVTLVASCAILPSCGKKTDQTAATKKIIIGFSQIGSESDWSAANSASVKNAAAQNGIDLRFADGQQKQENQIKALRSFIDQKVDLIAFSPVVETGWQGVLEEIKKAGIPVILSGREVDVTDKSLYVTFIGSDFVEEGRKAARWLLKNIEGDIKVFEMSGTPGASCTIDRHKGFAEIVETDPRITIIKSQDGNFERGRGKEVMEAFLKTPDSKSINTLYAHNDDMALGAIQAIKEAGFKPGIDIKIISVDAVRAAFEAMIEGELNCTVECNPLLGPKLFDVAQAILAAKKLNALATKHKLLKPEVLETLGGDIFEKRVRIEEGVFDQSIAKKMVSQRKY
jgi:ABC-type sugar transport system substrate-binding protein